MKLFNHAPLPETFALIAKVDYVEAMLLLAWFRNDICALKKFGICAMARL